MKKNKKTTRRAFIAQTGILTAGITMGMNHLSAKSYNNISGANGKIRVGFIGVGNRGSQLLNLFMKEADCEIGALCDIYEPYLLRDRSKVDVRYLIDRPGQVPKMDEKFTNKPTFYNDYRKLLADKNIDAVCIATPDHWHAIITNDALRAGKDVYVEKPLTATVKEGRAMVNAQKASNCVVAVGLNRRGSLVYQKLSKELASGKIGKISSAVSYHISNMYPIGIGKMKPEAPPQGFNWDMWLGPRAFRPYQYNIAPYMFRWWHEYSSQMGNWGVHSMDAIRWLMGEVAPIAVTAQGGKYVLNDDRTIPDTMQTTFEFASGAIASFNIYEASNSNVFPYGDIEFRGTKGTLYSSEAGYRIIPTKRGQFQSWDKQMDGEELDVKYSMLKDGSNADSTTNLVHNFLDCIRTRKEPFCTLEDGHRSTCFAHLANISLAVKQRLEWDPINERFINSEKANEMLGYEYRKPWKL